MPLEVSACLEVLVAEVAGVVVRELQPQVRLSVWATGPLVAVELPFGWEGPRAVIASHVACPVEHVTTHILLLDDLCEVRV